MWGDKKRFCASAHDDWHKSPLVPGRRPRVDAGRLLGVPKMGQNPLRGYTLVNRHVAQVTLSAVAILHTSQEEDDEEEYSFSSCIAAASTYLLGRSYCSRWVGIEKARKLRYHHDSASLPSSCSLPGIDGLDGLEAILVIC